MENLRSAREIGLMRKAGLLVWEAHQLAASMVRPGVTTGEVDAAVEGLFQRHGAVPLFKNFPNSEAGGPPFPAVTCISVNEEVVHGIPGPRRLVEGDIVSIDTGCRLPVSGGTERKIESDIVSIDAGCKLAGWCGDAAATYPVGQIDSDVRRLLDVSRAVLDLAIELIGELIAKRTKRQKDKDEWPRWREVAAEMERYVKKHGFSVVEQFVGHGIGQQMHEDPQVPNFCSKQLKGTSNFELRPGLVIAVEPMVNMGKKYVATCADRWTQATADGLPSAHFEHTIAVTESGPYVLTASPGGETGWAG